MYLINIWFKLIAKKETHRIVQRTKSYYYWRLHSKKIADPIKGKLDKVQRNPSRKISRTRVKTKINPEPRKYQHKNNDNNQEKLVEKKLGGRGEKNSTNQKEFKENVVRQKGEIGDVGKVKKSYIYS